MLFQSKQNSKNEKENNQQTKDFETLVTLSTQSETNILGIRKDKKPSEFIIYSDHLLQRVENNKDKCHIDKSLIKSIKTTLIYNLQFRRILCLSYLDQELSSSLIQTTISACWTQLIFTPNLILDQQISYCIDIDRTIPDHPNQQERLQIEAKLTNVLYVYAIRNPQIHYCQGFNFVVAQLLIRGYNEEEAFWMFVSLIEQHMPLDYYSNMVNVIVDAALLREFIDIYVKDLCIHMDKLNLHPILFLVQWFVCVFVQNLQQDVCSLIWSLMYIEGIRALHKSAIVLLHYFKSELRDIQSFPIFLQQIELLLLQFTDLKAFLLLYRQIHIQKSLFNIAREIQRKDQLAQYQKRIEGTSKFQFPFQECSIKAPICHYALQLHRQIKRTLSFQIFQTEEPINLIDDYCQQSKTHSLTANINDVLIGRGYHHCIQIDAIRQDDDTQNDLSIRRILSDLSLFQGISFFGHQGESDDIILKDIPKLLKNNQILKHVNSNMVRKRQVCFSESQSNQSNNDQKVQLDKQMQQIQDDKLEDSSSNEDDDILNLEEEQAQQGKVLSIKSKQITRRQGLMYRSKTSEISKFLDDMTASLEDHRKVESVEFAIQFLKRFN